MSHSKYLPQVICALSFSWSKGQGHCVHWLLIMVYRIYLLYHYIYCYISYRLPTSQECAGLTKPVERVVTPTVRPKSVSNPCVIEVFGGVVLSMGCRIFCWYRGFRHRTESDLVFSLLISGLYIKNQEYHVLISVTNRIYHYTVEHCVPRAPVREV